jgi:hypothetical protein
LHFVLDDGIVVPSSEVSTMPRSTSPPSVRPSISALREILRRLDSIERRLNRPASRVYGQSDLMRRWDIVEEEQLRRRVARDTALRRDDPTQWRAREQERRARNQETSALNRRLRAEGLPPMELEPSLEQRVKKLQQLEARTGAESATRKAGSRRLSKKHGSARRLH